MISDAYLWVIEGGWPVEETEDECGKEHSCHALQSQPVERSSWPDVSSFSSSTNRSLTFCFHHWCWQLTSTRHPWWRLLGIGTWLPHRDHCHWLLPPGVHALIMRIMMLSRIWYGTSHPNFQYQNKKKSKSPSHFFSRKGWLAIAKLKPLSLFISLF